MRLLKKTGGVPELIELGLRGRALKNLEEAILRPHGLFLLPDRPVQERQRRYTQLFKRLTLRR